MTYKVYDPNCAACLGLGGPHTCKTTDRLAETNTEDWSSACKHGYSVGSRVWRDGEWFRVSEVVDDFTFKLEPDDEVKRLVELREKYKEAGAMAQAQLAYGNRSNLSLGERLASIDGWAQLDTACIDIHKLLDMLDKYREEYSHEKYYNDKRITEG